MRNTPVLFTLQLEGWVCVLDASSTSCQWVVFLCCPVVTSLLEASQIEPNCPLKWSIQRHALNASHCVPHSRHKSVPHRWLQCCVVDSSTSGVCWSYPGTPDAIESRKCSPNIEHDASASEGTDKDSVWFKMFSSRVLPCLRKSALHTELSRDSWLQHCGFALKTLQVVYKFKCLLNTNLLVILLNLYIK